MSSLAVETELGTIVLRLLPDAAPQTCAYISRLVGSGLYDGTAVYRSDFVIQMGTHGTGKVNAHGNLPVNETNTHRRVSNTRGTVAVAHWCAALSRRPCPRISLGARLTRHSHSARTGTSRTAEIPRYS